MRPSVADSVPSVTVPDPDHIRKLEEGLAFNDRAVEEIHNEVRALGRRISELVATLARIEARLSSIERGPADDDASDQE